MSEPIIRLSVFVGVLALMALWEGLAPRRPQAIPRSRRWPANISISIINTLALRIVFPAAAVGAAAFAEAREWGLLRLIEAPALTAFLVSLIVLDLAIYVQHRLFHGVPLLWRLHRLHHADPEFDVTTGVRFHPLEILLSMLIKVGIVAALGAPVLAVLVFEVALNATTMFNHANVTLPTRVDRVLRWIVVTPDMHRVHHSTLRQERDSNFGFSVSWWDFVFGTYRAQPAAGHDAMAIGLEAFKDPAELKLSRMLLQPLRGERS